MLLGLITSCTTAPGAMCHNGYRSGSTGSGTCSHCGGVKYWIEGGEPDYFATSLLIVLITFASWITFHLLKTEKKDSAQKKEVESNKTFVPNVPQYELNIKCKVGSVWHNFDTLTAEKQKLVKTVIVESSFPELHNVTKELNNLKNISNIYISGSAFVDNSFEKFREIESLSISNFHESNQLSVIKEFINLKSLTIEKSNAKNIQFILSLNKLESLYLNNISGLNLKAEYFSKLDKLKSISLKNCELIRFPDYILKLPSIEEIHLGYNSISQLPVQILKKIKHIKTLDMSGNNLNYDLRFFYFEKLMNKKIKYVYSVPLIYIGTQLILRVSIYALILFYSVQYSYDNLTMWLIILFLPIMILIFKTTKGFYD